LDIHLSYTPPPYLFQTLAYKFLAHSHLMLLVEIYQEPRNILSNLYLC